MSYDFNNARVYDNVEYFVIEVRIGVATKTCFFFNALVD